MSQIKNCPCGTKQSYANCCQPFHEKKNKAPTAEKLMRSRYSAYAVGKIDYIAETNDPTSLDNFDREAAETWAKESEWLGLTIVDTALGQPGDSEGTVEFKAHFKTNGQEAVHHERSLFHFNKAKSCWYYVDGKDVRAPLVRTEPKVGRNDPCACGSGKKQKKCCG